MSQNTGRNETCSCGSGRKYRRCCGKSIQSGSSPSGMKKVSREEVDQLINSMDPDYIQQVSKTLQSIPPHQLNKFQNFVQQAMQGNDIIDDFMKFKSTLPPHVQTMLETMEGQLQNLTANPKDSGDALTEEQARKLVLDAVAEGRLSQEEADAVLAQESTDKKESRFSGISKMLRGLSPKKDST